MRGSMSVEPASVQEVADGLLEARIEQLGGAEEAPLAEEQASDEEPGSVPEAPSAEGPFR